MKIRGYRLSTMEVESILDSHPAILSSVVAKKRLNNTDILVAYYIRDKTINIENLNLTMH